MPIYEFRCGDCETSFETLVRAGRDDDAECPRCHGSRLTRQMSVFASHNGSSGSMAAAAAAVASNGLGSGRSGGGCCGGGCGCH
jgi:putative FmdB family regulatory protein